MPLLFMAAFVRCSADEGAGNELLSAEDGAEAADEAELGQVSEALENGAPCSPGTVACVGNVAQVCLGGRVVSRSCAANQVCSNGQCVAGQTQICTPNSRTCSGNATRVCNATGTAFVTASCAAGQVCSNGQCVTQPPPPPPPPPVCAPGSTRCLENTLLTCNAQGSGFVTRDCGSLAFCSNGRCIELPR